MILLLIFVFVFQFHSCFGLWWSNCCIPFIYYKKSLSIFVGISLMCASFLIMLFSFCYNFLWCSFITDARREARKAFLALSSDDTASQLTGSEDVKGNVGNIEELPLNSDHQSPHSTTVGLPSCWLYTCDTSDVRDIMFIVFFWVWKKERIRSNSQLILTFIKDLSYLYFISE